MGNAIALFFFCVVFSRIGADIAREEGSGSRNSVAATSSKRGASTARSSMAPFSFPQLYSCVNTTIPPENEHRSQSHEDAWLYHKIFERLPLKEIQGGTYLEIGGFNGVDLSNTFFFEKKLDFRGVLIEGHPDNRIRLAQPERPNAAIFTVAICDTVAGVPGNLTFTHNGGPIGAVKSLSNPEFLKRWHTKGGRGPTVDCVPIQAIIDQTGLVDIDLFSLDVEGAEYAVLLTLDFAVTNIRVLIVELDGSNLEKDESVRKLLLSNGFEPSKTSVRLGCRDKRDKACMRNEVFINAKYDSRKRPRQYYHAGTGVKCESQI